MRSGKLPIRVRSLSPGCRKRKMRRRILLLLSLLLGVELLAGCAARASAPDPTAFLYLGQDAQGRMQLFKTSIDGDSSQQLTHAADVLQYAIAPGGRSVAYVTREEDTGAIIWQLTIGRQQAKPAQLHDCGDAACEQVVWAPDGRRLIYEQRTAAQPGVPTLWWLDTETGETLPVLADNAPATAVSLSPDGSWLSYASPQTETRVLYHFESGRRFSVASQTGTPASWHPDSTQLLISDLNLVVFHGDDGADHQTHAHDYAQSANLFVTDIFSEERRPLTTAGEVDDGYAAWSPAQDWIAFGRKPARTAAGRQIWLVRPDGSEERPLTNDLTYHHGALSWSGDGRYLLYQRVDLATAEATPSVWLYDLTTGDARQLLADGAQPAWLAP